MFFQSTYTPIEVLLCLGGGVVKFLLSTTALRIGLYNFRDVPSCTSMISVLGSVYLRSNHLSFKIQL